MADSVRAPDRKKWVFPQKSEENQPSIRPAERDTERSLVVPFRGHIPGGLQPGKRIIMFGVVDPRPDRFYVALTGCCGTSGEPPSDVALELCIRFRDHQAIRRACMSGSWGDAERDVPFFPFIKDQPFKLEIRCERSRFRVFVDGEQLCDFQHRLTSLCHIDTMWIKGSVSVTKLA
ncbi:galectin-related protein-like isoform X1 [Takifugu rubripes]|uniref:Galectin n=1 Tax=Takifugu rubripes TaxID=31033 RepID=H2T4M6_TAKRU|nr:galectin-related protein-like isoform X1 [Takifugu rubripes]